jgi:hypothetical protein
MTPTPAAPQKSHPYSFSSTPPEAPAKLGHQSSRPLIRSTSLCLHLALLPVSFLSNHQDPAGVGFPSGFLDSTATSVPIQKPIQVRTDGLYYCGPSRLWLSTVIARLVPFGQSDCHVGPALHAPGPPRGRARRRRRRAVGARDGCDRS